MPCNQTLEIGEKYPSKGPERERPTGRVAKCAEEAERGIRTGSRINNTGNMNRMAL